MVNTASNEQLAERIEQLVRAHIAETRRAAQWAVERAFASAEVAPPKAARSAVAPKRRFGGRRLRGELEAMGERLYGAVCAHPGEGMTVLAAEIGVSVRELNRPMTRLKSEGRIRSVGERHQTRYFPMAT